METTHLVHQPLNFGSTFGRVVLAFSFVGAIFLLSLAPGLPQLLFTLAAILCAGLFGYYLIRKGTVQYTLTPTHFQQHLFKGGWVVKWNNISKIGVCHYQQDGWQEPLPWIGIKLKSYSPYIESICPRITTEILLSQRALLYLGAKQSNDETKFEDMVLDSSHFTSETGKKYKGLQAMLANRMRYQRAYFDYDIFIAAGDLDRTPDDFVGFARRYLAAADPEEPKV
ncbi:DUF2982 domain-containing protein [Vibrio sonorensis]|uniref:DUF2982 domain-containing protein n=1 Tax=Vibrio sonorensis TaxID=1004316 RepID=UPI0008D925E3|nr:DUF2982 domain-containing protein [Vibrio sonorensis]